MSGKPDNPVARVRCVQRMGGLTDLERLVLIALACHDGQRGAFPTFAELADEMVRPRWSVTRIVGSLREKGAIRTRRSQHFNFYEINYLWPVPFQKAEMVRHLPEGGDGPPSDGAHPESDGGRALSQKAEMVRHRKGERESLAAEPAPPALPARGPAGGACFPETVPRSMRRDVRIETTPGGVEVRTPTRFIREYLEENHRAEIAAAYSVEAGAVQFVTVAEMED